MIPVFIFHDLYVIYMCSVMMFDNFLVPSSSLLNRTGDVDPDGHYISPIKDKKKRLGASLGNLSAGRVGIVGMAKCNLVKAVTIAVRYSAVRRQFGPQESSPELPVIEYQLQQWRLLPHVAGAYVLVHFAKAVRADFVDMQKAQLMKTHAADHLAAVGAEMHAISSCAKPLASWLARDAIQECREACGGHGYLAGIGDIIAPHQKSLWEFLNSYFVERSLLFLMVFFRISYQHFFVRLMAGT